VGRTPTHPRPPIVAVARNPSNARRFDGTRPTQPPPPARPPASRRSPPPRPAGRAERAPEPRHRRPAPPRPVPAAQDRRSGHCRPAGRTPRRQPRPAAGPHGRDHQDHAPASHGQQDPRRRTAARARKTEPGPKARRSSAKPQARQAGQPTGVRPESGTPQIKNGHKAQTVAGQYRGSDVPGFRIISVTSLTRDYPGTVTGLRNHLTNRTVAPPSSPRRLLGPGRRRSEAGWAAVRLIRSRSAARRWPGRADGRPGRPPRARSRR